MSVGQETLETLALARLIPMLGEEHRARVLQDSVLRTYPAGHSFAKRGQLADHWYGVIRGTVKIQVASSGGRETTLATFSDGCWFGEGTLLKEERWPFDAVALGESTLIAIPAGTFRWLLNNSFPFNRFLIDQLNARLGQFIARCEHARLHHTDQHVAHCIAELLDPRLYPVPEMPFLRMSQEEVGHLSGVSRAVVNRVLSDLEKHGIVRVSYGAIRLIDPEGLRRFSGSPSSPASGRAVPPRTERFNPES